MKEQYQTRRDYLVQQLAPLGFEVTQPNGAFYLFCKLPAAIQTDSWQFCVELAEQAKVACIQELHLAQKEKVISGFLMLAAWKNYMRPANGSKTFNRTVIHRFYQNNR